VAARRRAARPLATFNIKDYDFVEHGVGLLKRAGLRRELDPGALALHHAVVAVGTALEGGPPLRSQRAGLPHWAPASGSDGQALGRERVHHAGWWEPSSSK
jgi:hypothetical protein